MGDSTDIISQRPRFNRPTHEYIFTGSQFRGGSDLSFVRFSKSGTNIDICNSGIDISSSIVNINRDLYVGGNTTISGELTISGNTNVNNFTINGDLSVNFLRNHTLRVPSEFIIDPSGHGDGDITGKVIILGDLEVKGTTTTINSTVVDISDLSITLASNARNPSDAQDAGFDISGNTGASFRYDYNSGTGRFISSIGLGISGDLLPINTSSRVPVSYNTYKLKVGGFSTDISDYSTDWHTPGGYDISKVLISNNSYIKMEFKVTFIASTEAEQTLGFRVQRSINGPDNYNTVVFTDPSLGSNMGVGLVSVYNGTYIDNLTNVASTIIDNTVHYRLQIKRNKPAYDDEISTPFGIYGNDHTSGNYIFLQELYVPS
jgi:hypothetical protein